MLRPAGSESKLRDIFFGGFIMPMALILRYDSSGVQSQNHLNYQLFLAIVTQISAMFKSLSSTAITQVSYLFSKGTRQAFMRINPTAIARLKQIMSQNNDKQLVGVKISLSKKGCSGLAYNMDYIREDQIKKLDEVVEEEGIKVVIDNKAVMALVGTEMSFETNELGSEFVFNNPNEKGRCGCGASFHL